MSSNKNRKTDKECLVFNEKWIYEYFFIQQNNFALCIICKEKVDVLKKYNIRRHFITKHASTYNELFVNLRADKFEILKQNLVTQQSVFTKQSRQN